MPQAAVPSSARRIEAVPGFRHNTSRVLLCTAIAASVGCGSDAPSADGAPPDAASTLDRGPTWAAVRAVGSGTIRTLFVPSPGFAFRDEGGEPAGVTIEIVRDFARHVAERYGVAVAIDFVEEPDWSTFYARVRDATGGVFGLGNVTITEPRRRELRFSPSYLTNVAVLITHESVPELHSMEDIPTMFAGLQPLAFAGTLHERRLVALRDAYLPDTPIEWAVTNAEILERTAARVQFFAYVDGYNFWRAAEAGAHLRQHAVASDASEEFGIIMPLDSDWADLVDEYFAANGGLRERPFYRDLLRAHLGDGLAELLLTAEEGGPTP